MAEEQINYQERPSPECCSVVDTCAKQSSNFTSSPTRMSTILSAFSSVLLADFRIFVRLCVCVVDFLNARFARRVSASGTFIFSATFIHGGPEPFLKSIWSARGGSSCLCLWAQCCRNLVIATLRLSLPGAPGNRGFFRARNFCLCGPGDC